MYYEYEEGVKATVREHKDNICELIREAVECNNCELTERGYIIEELGRFLDKLCEDYNNGDVIKVMYSDGLNYFEVLKEDN